MFERKRIGCTIKYPLWYSDVFSKGAVLAIILTGYAQDPALIAKVYVAPQTIMASAAINC